MTNNIVFLIFFIILPQILIYAMGLHNGYKMAMKDFNKSIKP